MNLYINIKFDLNKKFDNIIIFDYILSYILI